MAKKSGSGTAFAVRVAALAVLGVVAVALVMLMRSPMTISEDEVRQMLATGELVGLPVEEATRRLEHRPPDPPVMDGTIVLEFQHVRGWRASSVELHVRGGRVEVAQWEGTGAHEFR
jgi:hypothetical protein